MAACRARDPKTIIVIISGCGATHPAVVAIIIAGSGAAIAKVRFENLIAYNCANDSTVNGTFGLVATPSNHIAMHAACVYSNGGADDAAIPITSATIILRGGNGKGDRFRALMFDSAVVRRSLLRAKGPF
jgi:hypothetical protein